MIDVSVALLPDVKDYLNITWQDNRTETKITGFINRGMKRLQDIAGASLDFIVEDLPRQLLLDYCRYANSQALEVFEKNFQAELLELNLRTQAQKIDRLTVIASRDQTDGVFITVVPAPDEGNRYVYRVGTELIIPNRLDICAPGNGFIFWQGEVIQASVGQEIMIVEIDDEYKAKRAGKVTA